MVKRRPIKINKVELKKWVSNKKTNKVEKRKLHNGGEINMAVLAKNKPNMFTVDSNKAEEFIENFNKNVISEELLKECKKTTSLFKKIRK